MSIIKRGQISSPIKTSSSVYSCSKCGHTELTKRTSKGKQGKKCPKCGEEMDFLSSSNDEDIDG